MTFYIINLVEQKVSKAKLKILKKNFTYRNYDQFLNNYAMTGKVIYDCIVELMYPKVLSSSFVNISRERKTT